MIDISTITNPRYGDAAQTMVDCEVMLEDGGGPVPITLSMSDPEAYVQDAYQSVLDGNHGSIAAYQPPMVDTEVLRALSLEDIDSAATRARRRYISPDKDGTYQNKGAELDRWIADGRPAAPAAGSYPYIESEATETGMTVTEVGNLIEATRAAWLQLDPVIEGKCRGGKVAVEAATTAAEIDSQRAAAIAALDAI